MVGLVPFLKNMACKNNPLKQFTRPILCDMAHASDAARNELYKNDGVIFFLDLLSDPHWQLDALKALVVWYVDNNFNLKC